MGGILYTLYERSDLFLTLTAEHIAISFAAITIAVVIGGGAGIFISEYEKAAKPTLGVINFLYTIPSISMLGFLIPLFGVGNATAVIALTIYALLPMVRNTHTGIKGIDPAIIEAAVGMGSTRLQVLRKIKLPLAMPVILSGIRSMATMTIALAGIASFIGAGGLGVAIYRGITTNNASMTLAGSLLIAILALAVDFALGFLEKRMKKRSRSKMGSALKFAAAGLCLLLLGTLWHGLGGGGKVLRVATKPMTEQYILGEMLALVIEREAGIKVELTTGVGGGTSNIHPAMEAGEFDLYPEYTGTGWNMVLKRAEPYDESHFDEMDEAYREKFKMRWAGMYGFNDTYGLAVRREVAERYSLKKYSDLAGASQNLTFGAEYDFFERKDGYDALCKAYNLKFAKTMDMDIGLKYKALENGQIDVMVVFTTDGQLAAADPVVLTDDKKFFPSYVCGNVIREDTLARFPALLSVLEKFEGSITDGEMAKMNYEVETKGREPREVARDFLTRKGLLR